MFAAGEAYGGSDWGSPLSLRPSVLGPHEKDYGATENGKAAADIGEAAALKGAKLAVEMAGA